MAFSVFNIGAMLAAAGAIGSTHAAGPQPTTQRSIATQTTEDDVIVSAQRADPDTERREARDYVRQLGVASGERPAARWIDPVCPLVIGIAPVHAARVEASLRAIASEAAVPVAPVGCSTPNIAIVFTSNAGALTRRIAARSPRRMTEVARQDRDALLNAEMPIRWWYATEVRGRDGQRTANATPTFVSVAGGAGANPLPGNDSTSFMTHYNSSVVSTQVVRALRSATVVIDTRIVDGRSLSGLAAYAAFVSLAEIARSKGDRDDSIMGMFARTTPTGGLSARDSAFLAALYALPLDRKAIQHRARLAGAIVAR